MKKLPWAEPALISDYVRRAPTSDERAAVDAMMIDPPVFLQRPDLVVHSLSMALGRAVKAIFAEIEAVAGPTVAIDVARRWGISHGRNLLSTFLQNRGLKGGPEAFATWQDISHSMRGPSHATALFASYDDETVEIRRTEDVWGIFQGGKPDPYVYEMLQGVIEGYQQIDPSIIGYEEEQANENGVPVFIMRLRFARQ